jgi:hypothetical protein
VPYHFCPSYLAYSVGTYIRACPAMYVLRELCLRALAVLGCLGCWTISASRIPGLYTHVSSYTHILIYSYTHILAYSYVQTYRRTDAMYQPDAKCLQGDQLLPHSETRCPPTYPPPSVPCAARNRSVQFGTHRPAETYVREFDIRRS